MQSICKLFKWCWKGLTFIRDCVMNLFFLFFIFLFMSIISLTSALKEKPVLEGEQGALLINLYGYLADERGDHLNWQSAYQEINGEKVPHQYSTFDVFYAIESAAQDERIKGLVLDLNHLEGADIPALTYLGKAIQDFQSTGKSVIAYADNYTQAQYLLASYADEIYLNKIGEVGIEGLSAQNLYFKSMLEKLEVTPHIFRVGTYKSAVEPFLRDNMSEEARDNLKQWLYPMWSNYQDIIAQNRQIDKGMVLPKASQYLTELKKLNGNNTDYAKQRKLITETVTRLDLSKKLIALFGENKEKQPKMVEFETYLASLPDRMNGESEGLISSENKIAVVNVEGTIIDGDSTEQGVGGDTIAKLLRQAYDDESIKAVVLRVNSPGGSAFASEIIRQETENLQAIGKPVVVSMGNMAASGGYWISSTADYIVADKNTLTGSIGIFAMFPTLEKTIKKAGISADGLATSELVSPSGFTALTSELNESLQLQIEHGYDRFLSVVSQGRHLSKEEVDKIAQGRVWLGQDAYNNKLVDEIGDFDTAVAQVEKLLNDKLPEDKKGADYSIEWLSDDRGLFGSLMRDFKRGAESFFSSSFYSMLGLPKQLNQLQNQLSIWTQFNDPKGQYLYCLNCSQVK